MNPVEMLAGITVFILSFYGFGYILTGDKGIHSKGHDLEKIILPAYSSFLFASILVWILKRIDLVYLEGSGGPSWGSYIVFSTAGERMLIAFAFAVVYIVLVSCKGFIKAIKFLKVKHQG